MPSYAEILTYCTAELATILEVEAGNISPPDTFSGLGLDSAMAVHFVIAVEERFGIELYPSVTEDYPNLDAFCAYLSSR